MSVRPPRTADRSAGTSESVAVGREGPAGPLSHLGPNWFASVMGTGIVAVAASVLPVRVPGLHVLALVAWLVAALLLLVLGIATAAHWVRHPAAARSHLAHPVMSHFYGAPPMAMLTVGAGALLVGRDVVGSGPALALDVSLWTVGTVAGLACAVVVPYRAFTQHRYTPESAFGGWLMPVVPPMVSASTGALLVPHAPAGQARETLLLACYGMFGLSLVASFVVITQIWGRLVQHKVGGAATVPTLWIVLGPLGQSITAAHLLAGAGHGVLPDSTAAVADGFALLFGVITWGFALMWVAIAAAVTARTVRSGMPFGLTWWSFTFPVGTLVTGTSGLAVATGLDVLAVASVAGFAGLLGAWGVVATRTAHGAWDGRLLAPPADPAPRARGARDR